MIKKIIQSYNDSKYAFIIKMSTMDEETSQEIELLDDSLIQSRISGLKSDFDRTSQEIEMLMKYDKQDETNRIKIGNLMERKKGICFRIAFLASNSMNSLDACDELLEDVETDFKLCLTALRFAREKEDLKALEHFYLYFKDKEIVLDHYLINMTFGMLQYRYELDESALIFLRKAAEKRPENLQIHQVLKHIYQRLNRMMESRIEQNIIEVLEG